MNLLDLQRYYEGPFGIHTSDDGPYLKFRDVEKLISGEIIIKHCPCCGNEDPEISEYNITDQNFTKKYAVLCRYSEEGPGCGLESGHYKTAEEAIFAWEMRRNV